MIGGIGIGTVCDREQEVPEKSKSHVFLECARLEEFTGNLDCARQILERARVETKSEWKVRRQQAAAAAAKSPL